MENWPILSTHELESLNHTSLQLHMAAQFVGAAGKCLIAAEPDYSHTSMDWDLGKGWLIGKQLPAKHHLRLALDIPHFTLLIIDDLHHMLHQLALHGQTFESGIQWIQTNLRQYAVDAQDFQLHLEDDIPDHPVRHGQAFVAPSANELATFTKVRNIGHKVLRHFADQYPMALSLIHISEPTRPY